MTGRFGRSKSGSSPHERIQRRQLAERERERDGDRAQAHDFPIDQREGERKKAFQLFPILVLLILVPSLPLSFFPPSLQVPFISFALSSQSLCICLTKLFLAFLVPLFLSLSSLSFSLSLSPLVAGSAQN